MYEPIDRHRAGFATISAVTVTLISRPTPDNLTVGMVRGFTLANRREVEIVSLADLECVNRARVGDRDL